MPSPPLVDNADDVGGLNGIAGHDWVVVHDSAGRLLGWRRTESTALQPFAETVSPTTSLDCVLSASLRSPIGVVPVVDDDGRLDGLIGPAELRGALA